MRHPLLTAARLRTGAILIALVIALYAAVYFAFPIGNDYYHYYRPISDQWLFQGDYTLYDGANARLFYPPWTLFVLLPLGVPSLQAGSALLTTISLILTGALLAYAQQVRRAPLWAMALAAANLFTVELLLMGQLDMFVMAGVIAGWAGIRRRSPLLLGVGFALMLIKPYNSVLIGLVYLIAVRRWTVREWGLMIVPPLILVIAGSALVGFDWMLDYVRNVQQDSGITTNTAIVLWRGLTTLGLPHLPFIGLALICVGAAVRLAWRDGLTWRTSAIAIATTLTFTPYAHADYYVMLIPAFLWIAHERPRVALAIWLLSFTPLLRLVYGPDISPISVVYAAALLLAAWFPRWGRKRRPQPDGL